VHEFRLWVTNLDGSNPQQVAANATNVSWSPDGKRLAYISRNPPQQLRLVNVDGSGDVIVPGATPGGFQGLAWSPDGGRIAFEGMRDGARTVYVINTDGTGLRDVEENLPGPGSGRRSSGEPTWSPDGKRLASHRFLIYGQTSQETKLWVVTLATGDARPITTGSGTDVRPDWSPTGELIAFLRFNDGEVPDVYVVRPDGSGLTRITDTPSERDEQPGWLPD
jgi:Tol biopolymer transport system component